MNRFAPIMLLGLAACSVTAPAEQQAQNGSSAADSRPLTEVSSAAIAEGNRDFALALFRQLAREDDGNIFLSPVSIATAFGPVTAGAAGDTREGIVRALRYPTAGSSLHPAIARLNADLERDSEGTKLTIANALWLKRGYTVGAPFLSTARDTYRATVSELDFGGDPQGSANAINAWVRKRTNDRIPSIIAASNLDSMTRLVVTNAVYFLGDWQFPFNAAVTRPGAFRIGDRRQVSVPMMSQRNRYRVHAGDGFSAIDLPYKDPRIAMTIMLPHDRDGLAALEAGMTPAQLRATLESLDASEPGDVQLTMPKFAIESGYNLNAPLIALGMADAFDPHRADFSPINATERLFIHQVLHKTFLRVDEKGTEAAAATSIEVGIESMPMQFTVDHPFILMIRDRESGALLFYGRVIDPSGGKAAVSVGPPIRGSGDPRRRTAPQIVPLPPPSVVQE